MNSEQWQRVETLYHQALECDLEARPSFLTETCSDEQVRLEVAALLKYDSRATNFIETPAFKQAARRIAAEAGPELDSIPPREVGPYRLLAPLGRGGMGEVYLALDTRLNRKVAIKLLPSAFTSDPERARRFQQEARATSALSHPNIVTVFEVGEAEGRPYIVSEYVEGETLRQLLNSGSGKGLELHTALGIAAQVIQALQAAHGAGVIHRDIKPENVIVRPDGLVKVLDFGLAKLNSEEFRETESQSLQLTRAGLVMGTAAYMSPEQARGQQIDSRTDVFSFGALLYEMVSGQRPFTGATPSDVIAAVLIKEPEPLAKVARRITPPLAALVHRSLEKQAEKRFQSARDLALALQALNTAKPRVAGFHFSPAALLEAATARWQWVRQRPRFSLIAAIALALLVVITILPLIKVPTRWRERPARAFTFKLPEGWGLRRSEVPAVSPDGRLIIVSAFPASDRAGRDSALWLRQVDSDEARFLAGTEGGVAPFWSPDSHYAAFWQQGKLKRIDVSSGAISPLLDEDSTLSSSENSEGEGRKASVPSAGAWGAADALLFSRDSRLERFTLAAATPVALDRFADQETGQYNPSFLPDGRHFLYYSRNKDGKDDGIYLASVDSGAPRKLLVKNATVASYVATGYLLFSRDGQVQAQHFDPKRYELSGDVVGLTTRLEKPPGGGWSATPTFSVSDNGVLLWRPPESSAVAAQTTYQLTWFDHSGKRLGAVGERADYTGPAFSPDERRLVVAQSDPRNQGRDLWVVDLSSGASSRLTSDPADEFNPVWSPDGQWVYFTSTRSGKRAIYRTPSNGNGAMELVLEISDEENVEDISPDGRFLIFNSRKAKEGEPDLALVSLNGSRKHTAFTTTRFREDQAQFSPNGRWVAYRSDESGSKILVQSITRDGHPGGVKREVSNKGGLQPRWGADGKELFYMEGNRLMVIDIDTTGATITNGVPRPLFKVNVDSTPRRNRYLVSRDGQRILVVSLAEPITGATVAGQLNWPRALAQ
jgi:serine/threonine protein kinase/Tol biopolymer transport system component